MQPCLNRVRGQREDDGLRDNPMVPASGYQSLQQILSFGEVPALRQPVKQGKQQPGEERAGREREGDGADGRGERVVREQRQRGRSDPYKHGQSYEAVRHHGDQGGEGRPGPFSLYSPVSVSRQVKNPTDIATDGARGKQIKKHADEIEYGKVLERVLET